MNQAAVDDGLRQSRAALAAGNLAQALDHVGWALVEDPMHAEAMAQLNAVVAQVMTRPDPLALTPIEGDVSFVTAANRSYLLACMQRWVEALDLITDVAEIRPDIPYLKWAEWWLAQPGVAQLIGWKDMSRGIIADLTKIAMRCPTPLAADDPRMANVQAAGRLIDTIRGLFPREDFVWFTGSVIHRRLGNLDLAMAMAEQAYHLVPAWKGAIGVANVLRDQHKLDEAVAWYRKALEHDPNDASALVDMADLYLGAGRWDDAIKASDAALAKAPEHGWAAANRAYAWFKKTGDRGHKLALMRLVESGDERNDRADALCDLIDPPVPYVTYLPGPGDASCNGLNAVFQQMFQNPASHVGSTLKLKLSHVEAPSVLAAFALQMEMWGTQIAIDYQVETIQMPDPRQPKTQVPWVLWQWDGVLPRPAMAKPDFAIHVALHRLAFEPFSLEMWVPAAQALARDLGVGAIGALLASLVNPPRPNGGQMRVLPWVERAQIATALVLAHIDGGWHGSERQQILYALLYGPSDWTTTAAIVALGVLARTDPQRAEIQRDVEQAFAWMRTQIPAQGFCCWSYAMACTWLTFDGLAPALHADLVAWKAALLDEVGKSTVYLCELEAKKFDLADETAKAQVAAQQLRSGDGGDPDPLVFPGQPVARLSDYVKLMKLMQTGNMMGALAPYKLDMMAYAAVATAWGSKLATDPALNAKFAAQMTR